MAKRERKKPSRTGGSRARLPAAGVILATMATVVALATGMFDLRDRIFPSESDTAAATSVPAYQSEVGEVCDEVNVNDRRRARDDKAIRRELRRADTTLEQRNALLDGVRRASARSGHALATFAGLATPDEMVVVHGDTETVWNRNLARLREYARELDQAGTRRRMLAAVGHLADQRPALARDGDRIRTGLERLGADSCDLETPIVTKTYTVPPLDRGEAEDVPAQSATTPDSQTPVGEDAAPPPASGGTGGANTPPSLDGAAPGAGIPSQPAPTTPGSGAPPSTNVPPPTGGGGADGGGPGGG